MMDMNVNLALQFFDPSAELEIVLRRVPHWSQPGAIAFITWRTYDSMPKAAIEQWLHDRFRWLQLQGINPRDPDWRGQLAKLSRPVVREFYETFDNRWHDALDSCHGRCELQDPKLAKIVADSLHHFDDQRYFLLDYVVMPNHVHLLASFPSEKAMLEQCESWKHYTATKINRLFQRRGRFWQQDGFDHLVRSEEQLKYLRRYIAANPERARLAVGKYSHFSKPLEGID
jgi:type I restriction enzyme R subunit